MKSGRLSLGIGLGGLFFIGLGSILTGCPIQDAVLEPGTGGMGGASSSSSSSSSASSSSSGGGQGGAGGMGGMGGGTPECLSHTDCPPTNNECVLPICVNGACNTDYVDEGTAILMQMAGDCKMVVCNGVGGTVSINDDLDAPDDLKDCTTEVCIDGTPVSGNAMAGDGCSMGGKLCDGQGLCVQCLANADCMDINLVCKQNVCVGAQCNDGSKNGTETDLDCGGACGASCNSGQMCMISGDCVSGVCMGNSCQAPSCGDTVKNGLETDVDCGGGSCPACADGALCSMAADCLSGVCTAGICQMPVCNDGVKNGSESGIDCGGMNCAICPTVLLLAGGDVNTIVGEYHPGAMWATQAFANTTTANGVGLAMTGAGAGVGALRANTGNPLGLIRYTVWGPGAGFGAFNTIGPAITMKDMPALAGSANQAHLVFWGDNFKYYYGAYSGSWSPTAEIVGPSLAEQSFGNSPPSATVLGNDVIVAYQGGDDGLYDQKRNNAGVWEVAHGHGNMVKLKAKPAIVSLTSGPELLIVYNRQSDGQLMWTARTNNVFSAPQSINADFSIDPVALVALPGGNAMLAFRGLNAKLYTVQWDGTTGTWGNTTQFPGDANALLASSPALTKGVGGSLIELAYVKQGAAATKGLVFHSRLDPMNGWTAPAQVGNAEQKFVALASGP